MICKTIKILILFLSVTLISNAQNGYYVSFTDKTQTPYSIDHPEDFLSDKAIERRQNQSIAITENDLPVDPEYTDSLRRAGIDVKHTTKWLNGAIVFSSNTQLMDTLDRVSFISFVEKTYDGQLSSPQASKFESTTSNKLKSYNKTNYGEAWSQIATVNGHTLHQKGYRGKNKTIAVIDGGFYKANQFPILKHLWDGEQIIGTKDFVNPQSNIFEENRHGMMVLSVMGAKEDEKFIGTAPEANYWLIRTEDGSSEFPIEPDYWICAAEFADSVGVDIINTSLGYSLFDEPMQSYSYSQINGTSRISIASDIASSKGMLVVTSAGNEGNDPWKYISVPADANNCLAVGAVDAAGNKAPFSSFGPTYDGRIKPDISAMGASVAVIDEDGTISRSSGTSFSSPIIAGLAACLWQAFPNKSAEEIRQLIKSSANQADVPDNNIGYGIPNFDFPSIVSVESHNAMDNKWHVSPNPFNQHISLSNTEMLSVNISIYDITGNLKYKKSYTNTSYIEINDVMVYPKGIYILIIENKSFKQHIKVIKNR